MPRRPKNPESGPRLPLSLRTSKEIKARLERHALVAGRSISQEAEMRIIASFDLPEIIRQTVLLTINEVFGDNDASNGN